MEVMGTSLSMLGYLELLSQISKVVIYMSHLRSVKMGMVTNLHWCN